MTRSTDERRLTRPLRHTALAVLFGAGLGSTMAMPQRASATIASGPTIPTAYDIRSFCNPFSIGPSVASNGYLGGAINTGNQDFHAAYYDGSQVHDLGTLNDGDPNQLSPGAGNFVNAGGNVVGSAYTPNYQGNGTGIHAFLAAPGSGAINLLNQTSFSSDPRCNFSTRTEFSCGFSQANGVSDSGYVTGLQQIVNDGAFLYHGGTAQLISAGRGQEGVAVNNAGHVAGDGSSAASSAWLYNGSLVPVGMVNGNGTFVTSINNNDEIGGYYPDSGGQNRAYYWNGSIHDLSSAPLLANKPSQVVAINDQGLIVGNMGTGGWISDGASVVDLSSFIPSGQSYHFGNVAGITASGKVFLAGDINSAPGVIYELTPLTATQTGSSDGTEAAASVGGMGPNSLGSYSANASGASGAVTVGSYADNPAVGSTPPGGQNYFDVKVSRPNSFNSAQIVDCNLGTGKALYWFNGTTWKVTGPISLDTPTAGCATLTVTGSSMPNLSQLSGTRFAAGTSSAPTMARVLAAHATRHAGVLTLSWRTTRTGGIVGFNLYAGNHRLNAHLIAVHRAATYTFHTHWNGHGPYTLHVLEASGRAVTMNLG